MGEDDWLWLKRWLKFHVRLLGRHFHILRWTECSASCEGGTQSRLFGFPDSLWFVERSKTWSHHWLFCNIFVDAQRDPVLQDAAGMWICAFILFWSVRFCKKLKVSRLPRARNISWVFGRFWKFGTIPYDSPYDSFYDSFRMLAHIPLFKFATASRRRVDTFAEHGGAWSASDHWRFWGQVKVILFQICQIFQCMSVHVSAWHILTSSPTRPLPFSVIERHWETSFRLILYNSQPSVIGQGCKGSSRI